MSTFKRLTSIWDNVKEIELRPIAEEALQEVYISIVGQPGSGRHTLAQQMRTDPQRPSVFLQSPLLIADLEDIGQAARAHLIILILDASTSNTQAEWELARRWTDAGKKVLVIFNKLDLVGSNPLPGQDKYWGSLNQQQYWEVICYLLIQDGFASSGVVFDTNNLSQILLN